VFLLVFVPGAGAWLAVVAWLTWRYFNPVGNWIAQQSRVVRDLFDPLCFVVLSGVVALGLAGIGILAKRAAGIPSAAPTGQTHGHHAKWTPPNRG
jgi:hypothetical protein